MPEKDIKEKQKKQKEVVKETADVEIAPTQGVGVLIGNVEKEKKETGDKLQIVVVKGKKKKKSVPFLRGGRGQAHIKATYNNTIATITDLNGAVLVWGSAGKSGFKGPKKSTPYAAGVIIKSVVEKTKRLGIKEVDVFIKGIGTGREAAVRALEINGLKVVSIKDVTPIPHGGCRPKKKRRV